MEQLFQIGNVVKLKSGGSPMTITKDKTALDLTLGMSFNDEYECSWFENGKMKYGIFPQDALDKF